MSLVCLEGSPDDVALVSDTWAYKDDPANDNRGEYLGKQLRYWCESCNNPHQLGLTVGGVRYKQGASWEWNGRVDGGLVLAPSQLMRSYRYPAQGTEADKADFEKVQEAGKQNNNSFDAMVTSRFRHICHTFIGMGGAPAGHIIWLGDCFHHGKPAPMCGQVRKLLPRIDWPGDHGRSWAGLYEKIDPPDDDPGCWVVGQTRIKKV
jgi:hypothetical protein